MKKFRLEHSYATTKKVFQSEIAIRLICSLLLMSFVAFLLSLSWLKWPDALVDYGRELYVPWQILHGKVLYRDIFHMYGPFAQYLNAMLFMIFGVGLSTLVFFNIICVAVVAIMLFYLLRRMFGWYPALMALFVFFGVFAFGQYAKVGNFNYLCPYSHDALYGLELSLLMFVCLWRVNDRPGLLRMLLLGIVMGLIFLTKVEIAVSAWIAAGAVLCMLAWQNPVFRQRSLVGAWLCGITLPLAVFFVWFMNAVSPKFAFNAILTSFSSPFMYGSVANSVLYKVLSGLAQPGKSLLLLLLLGVLEFIFILVCLLLSRLPSFRRQVAGTILTAVIICLLFAWELVPATELLRPLPLVLIIFCLIWNIKKPLHTGFALFALMLLLKIMLNVNPYFYGFLLAMPGAVLMAGWLVSHELWILRVLATISIFLFVSAHVQISQQFYSSKNYSVGDGVDRFITYSDKFSFSQGLTYSELIPWLKSNVGQEEGIVVIPEGVMINYLARRQNPGKLFEFTPSLIDAIGEKQVINILKEAKPEYVLITDRETTEHGAGYFGKDFGQNIYAWINQMYTPVKLFGADPLQNKGFGVKVFEKSLRL